MPIDKFMALLNDEAIYFSKITLFKDKYEGRLSFFSQKNVWREDLFNENNTPLKKDTTFYEKKKEFEDTIKIQINELYRESGILLPHSHSFEALLDEFSNHLMFCNSWFMKPIESHSMWVEYGDRIPTSIAIQTTAKDLKDSFYSDDRELHIHIGEVSYIEYQNEYINGYEDFGEKDLTDHGTVLELFYAPIMHKRSIYEDEHEVRAVISFESICKYFTDRVYTTEIPFYSDRLFKTADRDFDADVDSVVKNIPARGIPIGVSLNRLIKKVVISPHYNDYFYDPFIKLIKHFGLDPDVVYISDI